MKNRKSGSIFGINNKPGQLLSAVIFVWILATVFSLKAQEVAKPNPVFTDFIYTGNDPIYNNHALKQDEFYNPILQGCYPDPSITRKGDDYYLVNSSFAFFPGVPIFHSKDLVNWKQIGHVLDRPSQLKIANSRMSGGIYAPHIIYNAHNDTFYMITTQISGGMGNMVVKTKDPLKGWSDPIKLQFEGIDPSLFFDDNGKAYVVHNDAPEEGKELYNGHRVIKIWEYDIEKDQVVPGSDQVIVNGGVDLSKKPIWIEGPHLYKRNGRYYLMCAEGGTGEQHSEVIFVSDHPKGPYMPAPQNPILTQRHLPANRPDKVAWTGHADLVQTTGGEFYGVFLGVRPNEKSRVNTGRETFMLPVDWSGEFPVFKGGVNPLPVKIKTPAHVVNQTGLKGFFPNGNFSFKDSFTEDSLDFRWIGVRGPREDFIKLTAQGLQINPFQKNIKQAEPVSALFYRQQHLNFFAQVNMRYMPGSSKDLAGMTCFQNERFNYVFGVTKKGDDCYIVLQKNQDGESTIVAEKEIKIEEDTIRLKVEAKGDDYSFSYSLDNKQDIPLIENISGAILSTDVAGGFTGALIGLYATSANDAIQ